MVKSDNDKDSSAPFFGRGVGARVKSRGDATTKSSAVQPVRHVGFQQSSSLAQQLRIPTPTHGLIPPAKQLPAEHQQQQLQQPQQASSNFRDASSSRSLTPHPFTPSSGGGGVKKTTAPRPSSSLAASASRLQFASSSSRLDRPSFSQGPSLPPRPSSAAPGPGPSLLPRASSGQSRLGPPAPQAPSSSKLRSMLPIHSRSTTGLTSPIPPQACSKPPPPANRPTTTSMPYYGAPAGVAVPPQGFSSPYDIPVGATAERGRWEGKETLKSPEGSCCSNGSASSAAASFFARAAQRISESSRSKKKHRSRPTEQVLPTQPTQPAFLTNFCSVIGRSPPPVPSSLLRPFSNTENSQAKVKVMLRICPVDVCNAGNSSSSGISLLSIDQHKRQVIVGDPSGGGGGGGGGGFAISARRNILVPPKMFAFDAIIEPNDPLSDICETSLVDILQSVVHGSDGCLFNYGHARLGKTYTMMGVDDSGQTLGVIPCAISWLFRLISSEKERTGARFSVRVSAVEVTGKQETLRDLLADIAQATESGAMCPGVYLREDPVCGTQLENQSELRAPTAEQAAYYLDAAIAARTVPEFDDDARNSHLLFTIHVYQYRLETTKKGENGVAGGRSRLHLIDFGSCNKSRDGGAGGEGGGNALSLAALGTVLMALLNGQRHVPYRESKLAQLIKESLGSATCRAYMIVHVSPAPHAYNETLPVIQLASRLHRMKQRRRTSKFASTSSDDSSSCSDSVRSLSARGGTRRCGVRMGTLRECDYTSSSEQSCDTAIYIGGSQGTASDVTDCEGPPGSSHSRLKHPGRIKTNAMSSPSSRFGFSHSQKLSTSARANSFGGGIQLGSGDQVVEGEELWIDGPNSSLHSNEQWVDGPNEFRNENCPPRAEDSLVAPPLISSSSSSSSKWFSAKRTESGRHSGSRLPIVGLASRLYQRYTDEKMLATTQPRQITEVREEKEVACREETCDGAVDTVRAETETEISVRYASSVQESVCDDRYGQDRLGDHTEPASKQPASAVIGEEEPALLYASSPVHTIQKTSTALLVGLPRERDISVRHELKHNIDISVTPIGPTLNKSEDLSNQSALSISTPEIDDTFSGLGNNQSFSSSLHERFEFIEKDVQERNRDASTSGCVMRDHVPRRTAATDDVTTSSSHRTRPDIAALLLANRESIYELQLDDQLDSGSRESLQRLNYASSDDESAWNTGPRPKPRPRDDKQPIAALLSDDVISRTESFITDASVGGATFDLSMEYERLSRLDSHENCLRSSENEVAGATSDVNNGTRPIGQCVSQDVRAVNLADCCKNDVTDQGSVLQNKCLLITDIDSEICTTIEMDSTTNSAHSEQFAQLYGRLMEPKLDDGYLGPIRDIDITNDDQLGSDTPTPVASPAHAAKSPFSTRSDVHAQNTATSIILQTTSQPTTPNRKPPPPPVPTRISSSLLQMSASRTNIAVTALGTSASQIANKMQTTTKTSTISQTDKSRLMTSFEKRTNDLTAVKSEPANTIRGLASAPSAVSEDVNCCLGDSKALRSASSTGVRKLGASRMPVPINHKEQSKLTRFDVPLTNVHKENKLGVMTSSPSSKSPLRCIPANSDTAWIYNSQSHSPVKSTITSQAMQDEVNAGAATTAAVIASAIDAGILTMVDGKLLSPYHTVTEPQPRRGATTGSDVSSVLSGSASGRVGGSGVRRRWWKSGRSSSEVEASSGYESMICREGEMTASDGGIDAETVATRRVPAVKIFRKKAKGRSRSAPARGRPRDNLMCLVASRATSLASRPLSGGELQDDSEVKGHCDPDQSQAGVVTSRHDTEKTSSRWKLKEAEFQLLSERRLRIKQLLIYQEQLKQELVDSKTLLMADPTSWTFDLPVAESQCRDDPGYLPALEQETAMLEKRIEACKARIMFVTCFDIASNKTAEETDHVQRSSISGQ